MTEEQEVSDRTITVCRDNRMCTNVAACDISGKCGRVSAAVRGALIGKSGRKSETLLAERLGGRQTPASGAAGAKGDVRIDGWLIEAKSSLRNSMSLPLEWLIKIAREAAMAGRKPALAVTFVRSDGQPLQNGKWIMIPEVEYLELLEGQGK